MKLSKEGYGDIVTIKNLDSETFMNLIHYTKFQSEYAETFKAMNSKGK